MFGLISKKIKYSALKAKNDQIGTTSDKADNNSTAPERLSSDVESNIKKILQIMSDSNDVITRDFNLYCSTKIKGFIVFIDGMINKDIVQTNILKPLMHGSNNQQQNNRQDLDDINKLKNILITTARITNIKLMNELIDRLLSGYTIVMIDGSREALAIPAMQFKERGVEDPQTESVVRGPRDGFTENMKVNKTLLRLIIKDPDLCFDSVKIGDKTRTEVCIAYLKSVADQKLIQEIKTRLSKIKIDSILESGYIEQFIEDAPYSVFPTVANSEKPDKVAARMLEGRAAIIIDRTPFVLTVPLLFIENFQSTEDYYSRPYFASLIRFLRFISFSISIFAPAIYVALTVYHQELIPTQLLISFVAGRQRVPFPAVMEALMMIFVFDILREAGVRLPKPVGSAVSIVGALVLGQSAVTAGLVSPIMVIVVATTAIASFVVPSQTDSSSLLRYLFLMLAGLSGGFGVMMGALVTLVHLASLRSFGVPYFYPIAPFSTYELRDTAIKAPIRSIIRRPRLIGRNNPIRQVADTTNTKGEKND